MQTPMPQIREYMTKVPQTIGPDVSVAAAKELMLEFNVRHLPVKSGGELVGILTDRNLKAALLSSLSQKLSAADVLTPNPLIVDADTPLNEVAAAMAEEKCGCVIVKEDDEVVGIFTTVDACRALRQLLETFCSP